MGLTSVILSKRVDVPPQSRFIAHVVRCKESEIVVTVVSPYQTDVWLTLKPLGLTFLARA